MTTIRRVPLDFDWPLNQVWHGYVLPANLRLPNCPDCTYGGWQPTGLSPAANVIAETFYALDVPEPVRSRIAWHDKITQAEVDMLLKKGRLPTWVVDPETGEGGWRNLPRTAADVNAAQHAPGFDDHDASNRWALVTYRCRRLRINMDCPTCDGKTHVGTAEQVAAKQAWKPFGPPTGEGWQVWEDVSEGSPISPVFDSAAALIDWLASAASAEFSHRYPLTREQAEALVGAGGSIGTVATIKTPVGTMVVDGDRAPYALHGARATGSDETMESSR
jgi:hypothetical protein